MTRIAKVSRKTSETDIEIELNIDGTGKYDIDTGVNFFNHMLESFSKHSFMDLNIKAIGISSTTCWNPFPNTALWI